VSTSTTTTTTSRAVCANSVLKIQDVNRGRYPTHSFVEDDGDNDDNNATYPSSMCDIRRGGSTYHSPEEYVDCADGGWADGIDCHALGGSYLLPAF
jgi:hypothetical protein